MAAENFVDAHIPNWQLEKTDRHCISVRGTIIYKLDMTRREFEEAVRSLDRRKKAIYNMIQRMAPRTQHLLDIDKTTIERARCAVTEIYGNNHLEQFIYDANETISDEMRSVAAIAKRLNIKLEPSTGRQMISIKPGRSFTCETSLIAHKTKKNQDWIPIVRLELQTKLEGPREHIESLAHQIRLAMLSCGPLTSFMECAYPVSFSASDTRKISLAAMQP